MEIGYLFKYFLILCYIKDSLCSQVAFNGVEKIKHINNFVQYFLLYITLLHFLGEIFNFAPLQFSHQ